MVGVPELAFGTISINPSSHLLLQLLLLLSLLSRQSIQQRAKAKKQFVWVSNNSLGLAGGRGTFLRDEKSR